MMVVVVVVVHTVGVTCGRAPGGLEDADGVRACVPHAFLHVQARTATPPTCVQCARACTPLCDPVCVAGQPGKASLDRSRTYIDIPVCMLHTHVRPCMSLGRSRWTAAATYVGLPV